MRKNFLLALGLTSPILAFFLAYYFNAPANLHATGFIQYDNVSYVAYARQYLDANSFHFQYSNPFNDSDAFAPIYFQPQTLLFALLLKLHVPALLILPLFTILSSFGCFLLLIRIYDHLQPAASHRKLHLLLLAWGGGILVIASIAYHYAAHLPGSVRDHLFILDPENGWWGLNLGRSLFFTCEAYYHLLFLGSVLAVLKKRWLVSGVLTLLLSLSHPFTGLELCAILSVWVCSEWLFNKEQLPLIYVLSILLISAFHLFYYLVWLPRAADHHSVAEQYNLTWGLKYYRMIPAYCLAGFAAVLSLRQAGVRQFFRYRENRIIACWFIVAFLLANHEMFVKARQPIHFTRGYIFTSLALLGLPYLNKLTTQLSRKAKWLALGSLCIIALLDNFVWIMARITVKPQSVSTAYIDSEQEQILKKVDELSDNATLLVSSNPDLAYLSTIHSSAYPFYSHPYTTPFAAKKKAALEDFLRSGSTDRSWQHRKIIFILQPHDSIAARSVEDAGALEVFRSPHYRLLKQEAN